MNPEEFREQLEKLQAEIFYTILSYKVYIALWPDPEHVDIINYRKEFFRTVWNALYHKWMMGFTKVTETGRQKVTLGNLLRRAEDCKLQETVALLAVIVVEDVFQFLD